ncbi:MAG TPA: helix-turn-helix domain-containing protein [Acidimicrobiales bacterium]|nr:helix-turn-helix domain-containing protein [Acidimicrobiales bacterium]
MKRSGFQMVPETGESGQTCHEGGASSCDEALVRAFRFLGKRWSGVILGNLTRGPLGFAELGRRVEGIGDSVLAERLSDLQLTGLIYREVQPGPPVSVTYRLSPSGLALIPAMLELSSWASKNLPCPTDLPDVASSSTI